MRRLLLPFGLGALMALGQAPLGWWFVTLPALALLLRHLNGLQAGAALWAGWAAGGGYFILALNWIVSPFLVNLARHGWMAPFALLFMGFGLAIFWALAAWTARRLGHPAALVASFATAELARGYVLTGFPWALIGHIWIDTPPAQAAALVGPSGLTLLTLAIAGLAATLRPAGLISASVLLAALWGHGLWQLSRPDPEPTGLTLRLVQPNAAQAAKWDPAEAQRFFDVLLAATSAPPSEDLGKPDLIIWPETALPYLIEPGSGLPSLIGQAGGGAPVALGLQRVEATEEGGWRGWNSFQVFDPSGAVLASYDKHHLVPFGEYIPFGDLAYDWFGIEALAARTGNAFSAGPGPRLLDLGPLGRVLPLICYEAVFPQDLRGTARPDWLLQVTNDAWFGTLTGPFQHAAQARLRAVEQGLPLARVANTGVTEMVDARGRVTASLPFGTQDFLDAALPGPLPATLFVRWGEWPLLVLLAGLWSWVLIMRRRPLA